MTEEQARAWVAGQFGKEAAERIEQFLALVLGENTRQNLIAPSTVEHIWARHAADSAQLALLGGRGQWLDIGTGGGFPGFVVGLLRDDPMLLIEPRRRRAEFLDRCSRELGLGHVQVSAARIESQTVEADIVSARAVAPVEKLLHMASGCAREGTRWLLPRGRFSEADLAAVKQQWRGMFHVEHSVTDPDSSILVIDGARLQ